ncbi:MAG: hypothetical protein GF401_16110 [Chitinivibrionales bacterium]|nr:hypothetical protein [Chitinivibrionales bacterium]
MVLPEFNENGDLPQGIYCATIKEIVDRFGHFPSGRKALAIRLKRIYKIAAETDHLLRFIIFGSFVTSKMYPNDIDVFLLMDDEFAYSKVTEEEKLLFDHNLAQSHFGCSVFWIRKCAAFEGVEKTIGYWQIKRDGDFRGIIEVTGE